MDAGAAKSPPQEPNEGAYMSREAGPARNWCRGAELLLKNATAICKPGMGKAELAGHLRGKFPLRTENAIRKQLLILKWAPAIERNEMAISDRCYGVWKVRMLHDIKENLRDGFSLAVELRAIADGLLGGSLSMVKAGVQIESLE